MRGRNYAIFFWLVIAALMPLESMAAPFDCPHLHDASRRTLSPMTQGRDGWFFRKADFKENYALLPDAAARLKRLNAAFAKRGERLVLLAVPPRSFVAAAALDATQPMQQEFDLKAVQESYRNYLEQLRATGIVVADAMPDEAASPSYFFKRDQHWTPSGARVAAEAVAEVLGQDSAQKAEYRTETTGRSLTVRSEMLRELRALCAGTVPEEPFPEYRTVKQAAEGEYALFGDAGEGPAIVLLGSSFSALAEFNFDGFLSQQTGREVANFAISAGQLYNAMISYVSLPEERRLKPRTILWEMLAHYDFNRGEAMLRQIVPAVGGECSREEAVAVKEVKITPGKGSELLRLAPEKEIYGPGYFLFLQADNLALAKFTLALDHADGDGEWFAIDRSEHFDNAGRFFVELTDEIASPLTSVRMEDLSKVNTNLEVRLCKNS